MDNRERNFSVNTFHNLCLTSDNGNIVHQPHSIIGRGSFAVNVMNAQPDNNLPEGWNRRIVAKVGWLPSLRKAEHGILEEIKQATACDPSATWISNHLPNVLHSPEVYSAPNDTVASLTRKFRDSYEERRPYLLVMERLDCIDTIQDCAELATAFEQIVRCHRWVYEEAQMLHRDISVRNLMFRRGENYGIQGVLNDFDPATPVAQLDKEPASKHRTGAWPYLAIELLDPSTWLQPPRHLYRYDLEAFLWVLLTLAVDPDQLDHYDILRWSEYSHSQLYTYKSSFMLTGIGKTPLHPRFEGLRDWLTSLLDLFYYDNRARRRPLSDTTVEMVTAETFLKILSP